MMEPDNRLIAAQLEKSWEAALRCVEACQARVEAVRTPDPATASPDFAGLADDLDAAWNAPGVTMRARQRLLRALVTDIIADVDEAAREVILTIHWRGGQHSQLRVRKPKSGVDWDRRSARMLKVQAGHTWPRGCSEMHTMADGGFDERARVRCVVEIVAERIGDRFRHHDFGGEMGDRVDLVLLDQAPHEAGPASSSGLTAIAFAPAAVSLRA